MQVFFLNHALIQGKNDFEHLSVDVKALKLLTMGQIEKKLNKNYFTVDIELNYLVSLWFYVKLEDN